MWWIKVHLILANMLYFIPQHAFALLGVDGFVRKTFDLNCGVITLSIKYIDSA